jgi:hypothetical protein
MPESAKKLPLEATRSGKNHQASNNVETRNLASLMGGKSPQEEKQTNGIMPAV